MGPFSFNSHSQHFYPSIYCAKCQRSRRKSPRQMWPLSSGAHTVIPTEFPHSQGHPPADHTAHAQIKAQQLPKQNLLLGSQNNRGRRNPRGCGTHMCTSATQKGQLHFVLQCDKVSRVLPSRHLCPPRVSKCPRSGERQWSIGKKMEASLGQTTPFTC